MTLPFTLAHPAAVLPLVRRPLCAAALVAGAVAPDAPYFVRALPVPVTAQSWYEPFMNATTSHAVGGALTVALPFALLLTAAWWVARRPLGAMLAAPRAAAPGDIERGVLRRTGAGAVVVRGFWVLLSLVIGVATHLVWDAFTHGDVAVLLTPAIGGLTWARLLQHASTVAGLAVLAVYGWRHRTALRVRAAAVWAVLGVAAAGAVAGAAVLWAQTNGFGDGVTTEHVLREGAETAGVVVAGAAVLYVVAWWTVRGAARLRGAGRTSRR